MTVPRNPPAYDPQSNGLAERAVGQVKGQIRALKLGLEARLKVCIDLREPIVDWITRHAASLLNNFHVGVDGRTAYFRIHHKNFNGKVFEIGEQVLAKPKRRTNKSKSNSTRARWVEGTWVGWDERTGEHSGSEYWTSGTYSKRQTVSRERALERQSRASNEGNTECAQSEGH